MIPFLLPTTEGYKPSETVKNILDIMKSEFYAKGEFGPFALQFSGDWKDYLEEEYNRYWSLRQRILAIEGIEKLTVNKAMIDWEVRINKL